MSMDVFTAEVLARIAERDPDGWETVRPTAHSYQAFEEWIADTFGPCILDLYFREKSGRDDNGDPIYRPEV